MVIKDLPKWQRVILMLLLFPVYIVMGLFIGVTDAIQSFFEEWEVTVNHD